MSGTVDLEKVVTEPPASIVSASVAADQKKTDTGTGTGTNTAPNVATGSSSDVAPDNSTESAADTKLPATEEEDDMSWLKKLKRYPKGLQSVTTAPPPEPTTSSVSTGAVGVALGASAAAFIEARLQPGLKVFGPAPTPTPTTNAGAALILGSLTAGTAAGAAAGTGAADTTKTDSLKAAGTITPPLTAVVTGIGTVSGTGTSTDTKSAYPEPAVGDVTFLLGSTNWRENPNRVPPPPPPSSDAGYRAGTVGCQTNYPRSFLPIP